MVNAIEGGCILWLASENCNLPSCITPPHPSPPFPIFRAANQSLHMMRLILQPSFNKELFNLVSGYLEVCVCVCVYMCVRVYACMCSVHGYVLHINVCTCVPGTLGLSLLCSSSTRLQAMCATMAATTRWMRGRCRRWSPECWEM